MKQWIKLGRIPSLLASDYIKATRLVIDSYYRPVAEEIVSSMNKGLILDLGTGPGHLPVEIVKIAPKINIIGVDLSRRLIKVAGQTPREPVLLTS
jgi:methylase of polypeptide subunit release factors